MKTAGNVLSWILILCGIATIGLAIYVTTVSYSSLPYSDSWREIDPVVLHISPIAPDWLRAQINEHRLVLPKLFLAADLRWFHARQTFLLVSILVIQFLHLVLLAWSMRVLGGWTGALWRTGTGLAAFCLFCPSQWENFVWGFQVCFVLPGLFATLSFVMLLLYWMRSRAALTDCSRYLVASILAAVAATYSLANGNLLWPLLVCAAILLRLRLSAILSFAVTGAISTSLYLFHYVRPPQHASIESSVRSPLQLLRYTAAYLGSAWVREVPRPAEIVGLAALLVATVLTLFFWSRPRRIAPFPAQMALTMLFCVGTAFITSLGRLNFGIAQAFSSRYQTVALLFWCCIGLSGLWLAARDNSIRLAGLVLQLCLLTILARSAWRAPASIREARAHGFELNAAATALIEGIDDPGQIYYVGLVRPQYIFAIDHVLKEQRLSIYSDDRAALPGKPLTAAFRIDSGKSCLGAIESATTAAGEGPSAIRVTGWAWDNLDHKPPSYMVFANGGIISGLGAVGDWRSPASIGHPNVASAYVGFTGYVDKPTHGESTDVYAISGTGAACLVGSAR